MLIIRLIPHIYFIENFIFFRSKVDEITKKGNIMFFAFRILRDVEANTVRLKEHGQDVLVLEKIDKPYSLAVDPYCEELETSRQQFR